MAGGQDLHTEIGNLGELGLVFMEDQYKYPVLSTPGECGPV